MSTIETLKAMRRECLERADALDYCIRMLEGNVSADLDTDTDTDIEPYDEFQPSAPKKRKRKAGNTTFTMTSETKPAINPPQEGGILMWSDSDDELHG